MADRTPRLDLPYLQPAQAQKHLTHNEALAQIDRLAQLVLETVAAEVPPVAPAEGAVFGLGPAPTGAWAGEAGQLACWDGSGWVFVAPQEGWRAWDRSRGLLCIHGAGGWTPLSPSHDDLPGLGIGAASDPVNRLTVVSEASLFDHAGGSHRMKINREDAAETASVLFQTGYGGRAEIGLAGGEALSVKVSPDGTGWTEALAVAPDSGLVSGEAVQAAPGDVTPGRLARADYAYGPGNLLGTVSQAAGLPTGAVIEQGSTAEGEYLRLADGTQICWQRSEVPLSMTVAYGPLYIGYTGWTFARAFAAPPVVSPGETRWGTGASWAACYSVTTTGFWMRHYDVFSRSEQPETISYMAVGRWL